MTYFAVEFSFRFYPFLKTNNMHESDTSLAFARRTNVFCIEQHGQLLEADAAVERALSLRLGSFSVERVNLRLFFLAFFGVLVHRLAQQSPRFGRVVRFYCISLLFMIS